MKGILNDRENRFEQKSGPFAALYLYIICIYI